MLAARGRRAQPPDNRRIRQPAPWKGAKNHHRFRSPNSTPLFSKNSRYSSSNVFLLWCSILRWVDGIALSLAVRWSFSPHPAGARIPYWGSYSGGCVHLRPSTWLRATAYLPPASIFAALQAETLTLGSFDPSRTRLSVALSIDHVLQSDYDQQLKCRTPGTWAQPNRTKARHDAHLSPGT